MAIKQTRDFIVREMGKVIIGQEDCIEQIVLAFLAGGHVILEGVPGLAKTLMARSFAKIIGKDFKRIQFTPDLMPTDIVGNSVFNLKTQEFEFKKGPLFTNILLADEINRASPKTQSALLEIMQERQVTADGIQFEITRPYMVIATQNPIEFEGTYPLPEAQLDRFMMKIVLGYPDIDAEREILRKVRDGFESEEIDSLPLSVLPDGYFDACRKEVAGVFVDDSIIEFITEIVTQTRTSNQIILGASTRAATAILKLARYAAALDERTYVIPDDVKCFIKPVLRHRVVLHSDAEIEGINADTLIDKIALKVKVPR